jgi:hypothetical protein
MTYSRSTPDFLWNEAISGVDRGDVLAPAGSARDAQVRPGPLPNAEELTDAGRRAPGGDHETEWN